MVCALGAVLLLSFGALPGVAAAKVLTVTTTADGLPLPGEESCTGAVGIKCTLREAIDAANAETGTDRISFIGIPAGSTLVVEENALPDIFERVRIEGGSATGAAAGRPGLALAPINFTGGTGFVPGLSVRAGAGTLIEDLAIGGFGIGIQVGPTEGGLPTDTEICGSYLGTELNGEVADPNEVGVEIQGNPGERPERTVVGSPGGGCEANVISGNSHYGVLDSGLDTKIAGNSIGIGAQPSGEILPNGAAGGVESAGILETATASGALIGGIEPAGQEADLISRNFGPGVLVENSASEVSIRHSSFSENEGLGIEIAAGTPPAPPLITRAASPAAHELEVDGTVAGTAGETVEIDFYGNPACDPSGAGEGQTFLGTANVPIGADPTGFSASIPVEVPADDTAIAATVTGEAGATSEFAACAGYTPPPRALVVRSLGDVSHGECAAACTLRDAIEAANEFANHDTIEFAVAGAIEPDEEDLPALSEPVTIDGTTAPGYSAAPLVVIDGTKALNEGPTEGLVISLGAAGSRIEGLEIRNFAWGIRVGGNQAAIDRDTIVHNTEVGVRVGSLAPATSIRRSLLFDDGAGPIVFETPNAGPAPQLDGYLQPAGETILFVPLEGALPNHTYALDVFADSRCEASGHGPAEVLLGSGEATTDGTGSGEVEVHGRALAGIDAEAFTIIATDLTTGTTSSEIGHCTFPPIETSIGAGPAAATTSTEAAFSFSGSTVGRVEGFECKLDGGGFTPCSSPQAYSGLAVGPHTFAVRAFNGEGAGDPSPASYGWTVVAPSVPSPPARGSTVKLGPEPTNGETIVVAPTDGKVSIKLPGTNKVARLAELKEIPIGATIDATKGKVRLTSIDPDGTEQTATFFGGVFKVKQKEGSNLVVLELLDTGVCPAQGSSLAARPGSGTSGKLWGSGHGSFKTEGNQGAATVRGTIWLVEDRCDGTTFFKTRRGVVSVRDFVLDKTLSLPAGKTYVAGEG